MRSFTLWKKHTAASILKAALPLFFWNAIEESSSLSSSLSDSNFNCASFFSLSSSFLRLSRWIQYRISHQETSFKIQLKKSLLKDFTIHLSSYFPSSSLTPFPNLFCSKIWIVWTTASKIILLKRWLCAHKTRSVGNTTSSLRD